ncbi:hypothetical protein MASR1M31_09720 [Porphyromonadaceae bacterium]
MLGGIKAVIWTIIQGIILIGGAIACIIAIMIEMPEGPMQNLRSPLVTTN